MKSVKLKPKMHIRHKLIDEQSKWKTLSSQPKKTCTNKNWVIIRIDGDKIANVETEKKWGQTELKSVLGKKWNQMNLLYIYVTQKNFFKRVQMLTKELDNLQQNFVFQRLN